MSSFKDIRKLRLSTKPLFTISLQNKSNFFQISQSKDITGRYRFLISKCLNYTYMQKNIFFGQPENRSDDFQLGFFSSVIQGANFFINLTENLKLYCGLKSGAEGAAKFLYFVSQIRFIQLKMNVQNCISKNILLKAPIKSKIFHKISRLS